MFQASALLAVLLGCSTCSAHRLLLQDVPCGTFIGNTDLPGPNLPGSGTIQPSDQACLGVCEGTPSCNAAIRASGNGKCYLKNVPAGVVPVDKNGLTSYVICSGGGDDTPPPPPPQGFDNLACDTFIGNTDMPGSNLPGSGSVQPSDAACVDLCEGTATCNAAIRASGNGKCYLKNVPTDVVPVPKNGLTSYVICSGAGGDDGPPPPPPTGDEEAFFALDGCPANTPKISAGKHQTTLLVKPAARSAYQGPNPLAPMNSNFEITLPYNTIQNGQEYCFVPSPGNTKVLVGGTLAFKENGQCQTFPTKSDGSSCCTIYMWQPNSDGFYYDNCSMKINPDENGVWFFRSEIPGDESVAGWGPDPDPHFHFDVECGGCDGGSALGGGNFQWQNKFYVNSFCAQPCGATAVGHLSEQSVFNGETTYKYNIVLNA